MKGMDRCLEGILAFILLALSITAIFALFHVTPWFPDLSFIMFVVINFVMVLIKPTLFLHGFPFVLIFIEQFISKLLSLNKRSTCLASLIQVALVSILVFSAVNLTKVSAYPLLDITSLETRDLTDPSNNELLHNTIVFGVFVAGSFIFRLVNKFFVEHKWQYEDYCMSIAMVAYVTEMTLINVSGYYETNLYEPSDAPGIFADPQNVESRIVGSKIVIGLEQSMLVVTWGVKLCIWFFLMRLCQGVQKYERALWFLLGYIIFSYAAIMVTYYGIVCRPFSQYWAMPVQNAQCATYHNYSIVQMVFNVSSNIALFTIPLVLVVNTRTKRLKKSFLLVPFSLGFAIIICAILNKFYNFSSPQTTVYALWYIREASTAVIVGNLICSWKLLKQIFHMPNISLRLPGNQNEIGQQQQIAVPHVLGAGGVIYRDGERVQNRVRDIYEHLMYTNEDLTLGGQPPVHAEASSLSGGLNDKTKGSSTLVGEEPPSQ